MKRHFMLALVLTFCMMPLQGATLERLSLDEMVAKSTSIVRGTVTASRAAFSGRDIHTYYTIRVSESLKGSWQSQIEVVVPGGVANGMRMSYAGAPTLNAKRRLLAEHDIEKVGEKLRGMMPWIRKNKLVDTTRN